MHPLRTFVAALAAMVARTRDEVTLLDEIRPALSTLIQESSWLDEPFRKTHPQFYQQYLLYCDPLERFSVQSFVWGPGQSTPIHNHTVWGLVGVLEGAERCQRYKKNAEGTIVKDGPEVILSKGQIDQVSPNVGDLHTVANALSDQPSISIHVYGANIGNVVRQVFKEGSADVRPFVSGYSSDLMPNIWNDAENIRAEITRP
jgi:3-mercaptopropionate dioxygenase